MKKFKFKKMDAFASARSGGNPAGAVYLNSFDDITEQEMLRIARELKSFVSEVGYIAPAGRSKYRLRYFSSEKEVQFCGHATIAILYDLLKNQEGPAEDVLLETNKGVLNVENRIADENAVFITAPIPEYTERRIEPGEIARALAIDRDAILSDIPTSIVNAGNQTLCVPIVSLASLVSMSPDLEKLRSFCADNRLDVITVFTDDVADKANSWRTRVFAAPFGYLEDPATGSGNAALGYHLLKNNLWDGRNMVLEQNGDTVNPNIIKLSTKKDSHDMLRVAFGGAAVVRIEGLYLI